MNIFKELVGQKRPTLKKDDIPNFEEVSKFLIWFIKNEPIANAISNRSINDFFNEGYRPKFESYDNPEAVGLNIGNLQEWFVIKLFIDLNILKDDDINRFGQFINDLDKAGMETLLTAGELAFKYKLILPYHDYKKEIEKIPQGVERDLYKLNSLADDVLGAEIRILAWLYHEYFNEWWVAPKRKQSEIDIGLAHLQSKLGKHKEAIKIYDTVLEINPQDCVALNDRGVALCQLERHEEAIEMFDRMLEINQNHIEALNNKGLALLQLEKYEEAIEMCNKLLEINPQDQLALNRKGFALSQLGKYEEINETCNSILKTNPKNYAAQEGKEFVLFEQEKYEEVIKIYDEALKINPEDSVALLRKGVALSRLGKYEEAVEMYNRALEVNPADWGAFMNKGLTLFDLEKYEEAIEMFDRVLKIKPKDRDALYNKGGALFELEKYEEAIKIYDEVLKMNPEDKDALSRKNCALMQQNPAMTRWKS